MNPQVIRILELAERRAVIEALHMYEVRTKSPEYAPETDFDNDALKYCVNKKLVRLYSENFLKYGPEVERGTLTLLTLTNAGEVALYEYRQPKQTPDEQPLKTGAPARAVEALLGKESKKILDIARSDASASDRAIAICRVDKRALVWDSPKWAELLDVSDAAIRKSKFWKTERDNLIAKEREKD